MNRFDERLRSRIQDRCAAGDVRLRAGVFYPERTDGLLPAAAAALERLDSNGLAHPMVGHICSSQAFALNLFASLDEQDRLAVFRMVGVEVLQSDRPVFEFCVPELLGEWTMESPHVTQIDVLLRGHDANDVEHHLLIEVKLTELDFSWCSGYQSVRNGSRAVCRNEGPFGGDTASCFQLRNHNRGQRRRYDTFLGVMGSANGDVGCPGCWFRQGNNQPMRQMALAKALASDGVSVPVVALCAPLAHRAIWRRWAEAKAALGSVPGVQIADLPADAVNRLLPSEDRNELADRYLLELSAP